MNIKKITFLILLIVLINIIFIPKTFAFSDIISAGDEFLNSGDPADSVIDETKLSNVSSKIYNILLVCGIGVAVIVGAILGITFIMSSAEGKAKVSETLVPYIVGCVVVFGAFGIWKMAIDMGNDVVGDEVVASKYSEAKGKKAQEYYTNNNVDKLGDQEVIDLFENLKKYSGEDEVDPELYNYFKDEIERRKNKE